MADITTSINLDEKKVANGLVKKFQKIVFEMEGDAKRFAPVDTGRLRNSIFLRRITETHFELISPVNYSIFIEFGTSAHFVKPKNAKALSWKTLEGQAFSKGHWVSGIQAKPFMRPAYDIALRKVRNMIK